MTDPLIGRRVGSYVVEQLLGAGGMGSVYRGVQPAIGKRVAIKFLAAHLNAIPDVVARFFDEAKAVNMIGHENIVDIFDFDRSPDGQNYFVMELMDGPSLEKLIGSGGQAHALSAPRAVAITRQIAGALTAAHSRGIIHRDLKPENIFLLRRSGRDDFVKLLDFGIAKLAHGEAGGENDGRTKSGMVLGTPGYMAPEQASGDQIDVRADIYSLGVVLYRMLAGQLPFAASTHTAALLRQLTEVAKPLNQFRKDLPPALVDLVQRMLSRSPADRPSSMAEVEAALLQVQSSEALPGDIQWRGATGAIPIAPPINPELANTAVDGPPVRRSGSWIGLVIGLLAVAVLGALLVAYSLRRSSRRPAAVASAPAPVVPSAPTAVPAAAAAPDLAGHVSSLFSFRIESEPPGADVMNGVEVLGTTPTVLALDAPTNLTLRLQGYEDAQIDAHREDGVKRVVLARIRTTPPPRVRPPQQLKKKTEGSIGIDE